MAIVQCLPCKRLLFRPGQLAGRAWQCPSCGPTTVAPGTVAVPGRLATLLEYEYYLLHYVSIGASDALTAQIPSHAGPSDAEQALGSLAVSPGDRYPVVRRLRTRQTVRTLGTALAALLMGLSALVLVLFPGPSAGVALALALAALVVFCGLVFTIPLGTLDDSHLSHKLYSWSEAISRRKRFKLTAPRERKSMVDPHVVPADEPKPEERTAADAIQPPRPPRGKGP